jgi:hypothetical protein
MAVSSTGVTRTAACCCCCVGMGLALLLAERTRRRLLRALSALETGSASALLALTERTDELERVSATLELLSKAQRELELCELPAQPAGFVPSAGWERCVAALRAGDDGYGKWAGKRHKSVLVSNFVADSPHKARVDALLAQHVCRCFPALGATLAGEPALILLLLDAPNCGTTRALLEAIPQLAGHATRICIAQADPAHCTYIYVYITDRDSSWRRTVHTYMYIYIYVYMYTYTYTFTLVCRSHATRICIAQADPAHCTYPTVCTYPYTYVQTCTNSRDMATRICIAQADPAHCRVRVRVRVRVRNFCLYIYPLHSQTPAWTPMSNISLPAVAHMHRTGRPGTL